MAIFLSFVCCVRSIDAGGIRLDPEPAPMSVPQSIRDALRSAAACVTGSARRSIQAWVAKTYCYGSPRHTETVFGWNRQTVACGIRESESQEESRTEKDTRGRPTVERTHAELVNHADQLLGKHSQVDPKFQTETLFTRMTGESLRASLAIHMT
jgi:hypothetical protein